LINGDNSWPDRQVLTYHGCFPEFPYFATQYQKRLRKNDYIQPVSALVMLLLFTLSITPKRFLHDTFAHHKDVITYAAHDGHDQLSLDGFNCDTHLLVAESPFTGNSLAIQAIPPLVFVTGFTAHLPAGLHLQSVTPTNLRGPPALG
jgi:hypothetical protein